MRQIISDFESAKDLIEYINEDKPTYEITEEGKDKIIKTDEYEVIIPKRFQYILNRLKKPSQYDNKLIFGKDTTEQIVAIEATKNGLEVYYSDGRMELRRTKYWILADRKIDRHFKPLEGNQHYQYIRVFDDYVEKKRAFYIYKKRNRDVYTIHNEMEQAMIIDGMTMFKGMKVEDLAVLSFDIEGAGLTKDADSEVFVITNTFKKQGKITKKQFRVEGPDGHKRRAAVTESFLLIPVSFGTGWIRTLTKPMMYAGINLPPGETDMTKPAPEKLAGVMKRIFLSDSHQSTVTADATGSKEYKPFWKIFAWLIILLLLTDSVIANRLKR